MTKSISEFQDEAHGISCAKGWHEVPSCDTKATGKGVALDQFNDEPGLAVRAARTLPVNVNYDRVSTLLALTHSEVSEAVEELRKGEEFILLYYKADKNGFMKPEGVEAELADVIIRVLDIGGELGLDLETALQAKLNYNRTRPERHGGKKV